MNILHLSDSIELIGGVEVNISQLRDLSPNFGITAYWLGLDIHKGKYRVREFPDSLSDLFIGRMSSLEFFFKKFIEEKEIDIIHVHSISDSDLIKLIFELAPVVRSMHEPRIFCPGQGKFWRNSEKICTQPFGLHCFYHAYKEGCCNRHPKRLISAYQNTFFEIHQASPRYRSIIAMSEYMKDEAIKVGVPADKIKLNPHLTRLVPEDELNDSADDTIKSLLYVGRLSKTKGVHYFILAALKLLEQDCPVKIDIVGAGHDETYFKQLVPDKYRDRFFFHGWKNRKSVHAIMLKCYLLVFPSIYPEAFGISGIEALMRAKPVVGFNVGGTGTWLRNGITGFGVPVKDSNELANKIKLLLNNKNLYYNICRMAREAAMEEFTPEVHMSRLKHIYQEAVAGK